MAVLAQTPGYHIPGQPDPWTGSYGAALSADGRVLAGFAQTGTPGNPGFVWSEETGRLDFGLSEPNGRHTRPAAISGDGSTVVGQSFNSGAFVWRGPGTLNQGLGAVDPFHDRTAARGVSNNGSIVVGASYRNQSTIGQAFRWTSEGGMQGLGYTFPEHVYSEANAISRDGNVIVGMSQSATGRSDAFRWTEAGGMQMLPLLSGATSGWAYGTNHDGSIVAGRSGGIGVLWMGNSVQALTNPVGWTGAGATDVSDDGSVVIGSLNNATQILVPHIWTPSAGWQTPATYFAAQGFVLPEGWEVSSLNALSADGRTFAGTYNLTGEITPQAFVLTVPAPNTLLMIASIGPIALRRRRRILDRASPSTTYT